MWKGNDPSYSHLRVFRCKAFMHVPKEQRLKVNSKSTPYIFVGMVMKSMLTCFLIMRKGRF